jgi:hypothetical protein
VDERLRCERAFVTIQYVAGIAFSMLLLVLVANLLVDLYARGAIRDALDEGARAAVPVDSGLDACERKTRDVLDALVRGPVADVEVRCMADGPWIVAEASVSLDSWLPMLVPDWRMRLRAEALREG